MENGLTEPTYDEARRLAGYFNVDPAALFPLDVADAPQAKAS